MKWSKTQSNQWSLGIGLRRSTIYDSHRWMLWINHGFRSSSISWRMNPPRPKAGYEGERSRRVIDLKAAFERHSDEFLEFSLIESPRHPRPDVCAFLMLHDLVPGHRDIVSASEHDEFFLDINCDELAKVATDEHIRDLHRCGVRYNSEFDCLAMFA
jgi:hypothetical protein